MKAKDLLAQRNLSLEFNNCPGYLTILPVPWGQMLEQHEVLAIPASIFGSSRDDICVLSTLNV
ncbi:hypothetical protein EON80_02280 [bacterium]|nr:MAG: hypothetical protein EON80_02280 [bacterium]